MKHLGILGLLALTLAACQAQPTRDTKRPSGAERALDVTAPVPPIPGRSEQQNAPYSGYPGPVGKSDAGAPGAGTHATPADAGTLSTPPSTEMPGARPLYPEVGGRRR